MTCTHLKEVFNIMQKNSIVIDSEHSCCLPWLHCKICNEDYLFQGDMIE